MSKNIVDEKAYVFAARVIKAYKYLCAKHKKVSLFNQFLRSGTAITALVHEAKFAQSKKDFINKMSIALKEANETLCWINLLHEGEFINTVSYNSIHHDCNELVCLLVSIVKTSKSNTDSLNS